MHSQQRQMPRVLLLMAVLLCFSSGLAHAQWVFVARKALQVITSVAGELQGSGQGEAVDAATVLLEADADKIYAVAVKLLRENPDMRVLSQDAPKRAIAFAKGEQSASLKVSRLGDTLSQILVAGPAGKPGGASFVVEGILRVCHRMGVECSRAPD
ncbi:MAG TPA: hypothetical protein VLM91_06020 [Candidatus Methylomirabilis sp.]|nr:hypothetical protein [Candidatus Methylomirabilis sp.]